MVENLLVNWIEMEDMMKAERLSNRKGEQRKENLPECSSSVALVLKTLKEK